MAYFSLSLFWREVAENQKEGKMALLERNDTGSIAHLTLNDPEKLNALSEGMLEALQSEFDTLKND